MDESSQPEPTSPAQPADVVTPAEETKKRKRPAWLIALIAAFFIGGSAAAYVQFVHNSPNRVWERALSATSQGLDRLIELSEQEQSMGAKIDASFSMSSPIAMDGSLNGQWYGGDGSATMELGAAGIRMSGELRTVTADNASAPDMFVKVSGLEAIQALLGFAGSGLEGLSSGLSEVDDQWFVIDRTLLSQFAASAGDSQTSSENIEGATRALSTVLKDMLFSTDPDKAVFTVLEEIGNEDFEGTSTYKYKVGLDKENTKNFVTALITTMDESGALESMGLSGVYDTEEFATELQRSIDEADFSKATADVWVESSGKFIRNVRIYPVEDDKDNNYIDFGIPYTEGDVIPFLIRVVSNSEGDEGTMSFGFDLNQVTADSRIWFDIDVQSGAASVVTRGELKLEGSDEQVSVSEPEGARNIYELLGIFGDDLFPGAGGLDSLPSDLNGSSAFPLDDVEL